MYETFKKKDWLASYNLQNKIVTYGTFEGKAVTCGVKLWPMELSLPFERKSYTMLKGCKVCGICVFIKLL